MAENELAGKKAASNAVRLALIAFSLEVRRGRLDLHLLGIG
jgi:hypothetical protein